MRLRLRRRHGLQLQRVRSQEKGPGTDIGTNFKAKKGPDFASRLNAYYNVLGPNPRSFEGKPDERDPDDIAAPLRRALLIRAWLAGKSEARLDINSNLVDALLLAEKFTHGARSLEKLAEPLKEAQGRADPPLDAAAAPAFGDACRSQRLLCDPRAQQGLPHV